MAGTFSVPERRCFSWSAPNHESRQVDAFADVQGADALWPVDLVAAQGDQVRAGIVKIHFSVALDGVSVEQRPTLRRGHVGEGP